MNPLRILLVDDDSTLSETLSEHLRNTLKVIVYIAMSVPGAISELDDDGPFDLVISDYQLPPHTAKDLARHMRESEIKTPFLLHSGFLGIDETYFRDDTYWGLIAKPGSREIVKMISERFPHAKK